MPAAHREGAAPDAVPLLAKDYHEIVATGTARSSSGAEPARGALPFDLPAQPAVFAPDYAPEEISEIAQRLREAAGLPDEPLGEVANPGNGLMSTVKEKLT